MRARKQREAELHIRRWLDEGLYRAGDRLPGIVDMARDFGMADKPVRNAVKALAADGLLEVINGVGVFVRDPGSGRAARIMVLTGPPPAMGGVDSPRDGFLLWEIQEGVEAELRERGMTPVWQPLPGGPGAWNRVLQRYTDESCSGLINLCSNSKSAEALQVFQNVGLSRIVFAIGDTGDSPFNSVQTHIEPGLRCALAKALDHGHRRFALLYGSNLATHWSHMERFRIFVEFCTEQKLDIPHGCLLKTDGDAVDGYRATNALLENHPETTLIVAATDERARGVLEALRDREMVPGRDVSVVGYDDRPEARDMGLTTVRTPRRELGEAAVELLAQALEKKLTGQTVKLDTEAVFRESLGPAPAAS